MARPKSSSRRRRPVDHHRAPPRFRSVRLEGIPRSTVRTVRQDRLPLFPGAAHGIRYGLSRPLILAPAPPRSPTMADPNLSSFIWSVADLLRGDYKQSEYGKVILPFTVLRRLDCVLEKSKPAVLAELEKRSATKVNPEPFLLKK